MSACRMSSSCKSKQQTEAAGWDRQGLRRQDEVRVRSLQDAGEKRLGARHVHDELAGKAIVLRDAVRA